MRVALLCATRRGYLFLQKLAELLPQSELMVFSFREETWEPAFLDDIRDLTFECGGQFFEARQVGSSRWNDLWETTQVDLMFAVSWRYMVPASIYRRSRLGAYVFHDSLLPAYRGFAPTVWAIINGEDHTGVTLFEIADDVDAGNIVDQRRVPIGPDDTIGEVMERVTGNYLELLERNLEALINETAPRRLQNQSQATFTCKRLPEDNLIDWTASSENIYNLIRAVGAPYTGAYTYLSGERVRVWSAARVNSPRCYVGRVPGRVVEVLQNEGAVVLTGDGSILLKKVQADTGEIVCASELLNSLSQTLDSRGGRNGFNQ